MKRPQDKKLVTPDKKKVASSIEEESESEVVAKKAVSREKSREREVVRQDKKLVTPGKKKVASSIEEESESKNVEDIVRCILGLAEADELKVSALHSTQLAKSAANVHIDKTLPIDSVKDLFFHFKSLLNHDVYAQLTWVVARNNLYDYLFQLMNCVLRNKSALDGEAWRQILEASGMTSFSGLVMYEPVVETTITKRPIVMLLWCPLKDSIVGKNIRDASPGSQAMLNLKALRGLYPEFDKRLVRIENLNESLCNELWSAADGTLKQKPLLYHKVLDRCVSAMTTYMAEHSVVIGHVSFLIMCGTLFQSEVLAYLNLKYKRYDRRPQIVIGGHPSYWGTNCYDATNAIKIALSKLGCSG